jgi:hypothetical protein
MPDRAWAFRPALIHNSFIGSLPPCCGKLILQPGQASSLDGLGAVEQSCRASPYYSAEGV